jgi:hypothetical protein
MTSILYLSGGCLLGAGLTLGVVLALYLRMMTR